MKIISSFEQNLKDYKSRNVHSLDPTIDNLEVENRVLLLRCELLIFIALLQSKNLHGTENLSVISKHSERDQSLYFSVPRRFVLCNNNNSFESHGSMINFQFP